MSTIVSTALLIGSWGVGVGALTLTTIIRSRITSVYLLTAKEVAEEIDVTPNANRNLHKEANKISGSLKEKKKRQQSWYPSFK